MKKLLFIILCTLNLFTAKAQTNFIIARDGQKISIDWAQSLSISSEGYVNVYPADKQKTPDGKKVAIYEEPKLIYYEGRVWFTLPIGNPKSRYDWRIQEILCWTDKYIMTNWGLFDENCLLVFDWNLNMVVKQYVTMKNNRMARTVKANAKLFDKYLKEYFSDCLTIMDQINKNNSNEESTFTDNLSNLHCGTKDLNTLVKGIIDGSLDRYPAKK